MLKPPLKQYLDISSTSSFLFLLLFLFSVNVSIAGVYISLILLLPAFIWRISRARDPLPEPPRFFWYTLVFAGASLFSTFFSTDWTASIKDNRDLFNFLIIPILTLVLFTLRRAQWALTVLFGSTVLASIVGLFITLQRKLNHQDAISLDNRLKGFTSHWMTYSGLLMLSFVFFLVYQHYEKNKTIRKTIIGGLAVMAVPILLAQTRSVWVGIIASVTLFLLSFNWRRILVFIPVILVLYVLSPQPIQERIRSITDTSSPSNRDRIFMTYTAWEIFKEFPWTGLGANNVAAAYHQYRHPDSTQDNPHLHNNFLQILAERGLVGLTAFLVLLWFIFLDLFKASKGKGTDRRTVLAKASLFSFISFLVAGFFEYNFGDSEVCFLLLFFITLPFLPFLSDAAVSHPEPS